MSGAVADGAYRARVRLCRAGVAEHVGTRLRRGDVRRRPAAPPAAEAML